jgi:hypothetical protein
MRRSVRESYPVRASDANPRMKFHIGVHKTGTTVIQQFLGTNRPRLRARGVVYLGRGVLDGFAKNKSERDPRNGPLAMRLAELSATGRTEVVIGSCENLVGPPFTTASDELYPKAVERIGALRRVLEPYDTTVIITVRPQADFLESYYMQTINQGGYDTFDEWFARRNLAELSWRPLVETARATFGPTAVQVIDFELLRKSGPEAYLAEFMAVADPGRPIEITAPEADNASLSARGLQIALAMNPLLIDKDERVATRKFLQTNFSNRSSPRPVLLTDDQRADIERRYRADYTDLVGA